MTNYPGRQRAIREVAEMDAWLDACDKVTGNITEYMSSRQRELEIEYAALDDDELRARWEVGPWTH